jgi:transposase
MLMPPSLGKLIQEGHLVRVVNRVVDKINISALIQKYKGGGTSVYHPRMMLKALAARSFKGLVGPLGYSIMKRF